MVYCVKKTEIDYIHERFRAWTLILYPDSESYDFESVMTIIRSYKDYAFIKHESDEEFKKDHYHVNIYLENATFRSTLLKKLGIPEDYSFINRIDHIRSMNRYLTHIDFPERVQYDLSLCSVSYHYWKKFKKCYDDLETENEIINKIYYKIDELAINCKYSILLRELLIWVSSECYENIYKKYRLEFIDYIKSLDV